MNFKNLFLLISLCTGFQIFGAERGYYKLSEDEFVASFFVEDYDEFDESLFEDLSGENEVDDPELVAIFDRSRLFSRDKKDFVVTYKNPLPTSQPSSLPASSIGLVIPAAPTMSSLTYDILPTGPGVSSSSRPSSRSFSTEFAIPSIGLPTSSSSSLPSTSSSLSDTTSGTKRKFVGSPERIVKPKQEAPKEESKLSPATAKTGLVIPVLMAVVEKDKESKK